MTTIQKIGQRLKELRQSAKLSQSKIAAVVESSQPAIARYEMGEAHIPADVLLNYANYFDVSLDYIYCRTDNPMGTHYENKPKVEKIYPENNYILRDVDGLPVYIEDFKPFNVGDCISYK